MSNKNQHQKDHVPVRNLNSGESIIQFFQLRSVEQRKTRSGLDYLDIVLGDSTGTISGKIWPEALKKWGKDFNGGDLVKIEGRVEVYRQKNQLVIDKIRRAELEEIPDSVLLFRTATEDPSVLMDELKRYAGQLQPTELSEFVGFVLEENENMLKICPAAKMVHHAYKGGLLEHTIAVTRKVDALVCLDTKLESSLAVAGAMLHDIGKVKELDPNSQGRTPEGRLIGHVVLGAWLIRDAAHKKGCLDAPWVEELLHIVLSHHGEPDFGAPVRPMTREALVVHFLDHLDSRLQIMDEALESTDANGFSSYNKWLEGRAFAGRNSLPREDKDVGDSGATERDTGEIY